MEKIFDIHCHILPGLDDGPATTDQSFRLLDLARKQGILSLMATPHYSQGYQNLCPALIKESCAQLEERARKYVHSEFRIYPGQEIYYEESIIEKLDSGRLQTLAGSDYVLIEFPTYISFRELYQDFQLIRLAGYTPILAHADRYPDLRKEGTLEELAESGALIQLNYRPVTGGGLLDARGRWCREQLKKGLVHFLGTDMHDPVHRPPVTEKTREWAEKHLGIERTADLCWRNAEKVLKNERI